ncbi:MAG TPA: hypothetical protein VFS27_09400 [Blastocatellia bacterium]|jgi:hypothetical protein|nr:hypothetical protein [Blastocatellia bacterium]
MKDVADNEKLLTQYLLGNLPEGRRERIESEFLRDDQSYEQLLALEDELFYGHAQNKLSAGGREQFEKRFLSSEGNRERALRASALARKLSEAAPAEAAGRGADGLELQPFWGYLKSYFAAQSAAMRVSLATLAIVSGALIWLAVGIVRLRNEFNQFRTQQDVQEGQLRRQAQQDSARADELSLKLEREVDENAVLRRGVDKMQAQRVPSVVSLVLNPATVREKAPMKKLYPPGAGLLKLRLKLKGEPEYKSYQAILLTVEGNEKWSRGMLRAQRTGSGRSIVLSLPSRILAEGDYELMLKGYAADGALEETGDYYYLSINRR